jgi:DNA-binding phage protein
VYDDRAMEQLSPIVKTIKAEMERQEVSVQQLAIHVGISASTLYRTFNGEFTPNLETVENLLAALGLKIVVKR